MPRSGGGNRYNFASPGAAALETFSEGLEQAMRDRELQAREARRMALEDARIEREVAETKLRNEILQEERGYKKQDRENAALKEEAAAQGYQMGDKVDPRFKKFVPHEEEQTIGGRMLGGATNILPGMTQNAPPPTLLGHAVGAPAPNAAQEAMASASEPVPATAGPGPMMAPAMIAQTGTGELTARGTVAERLLKQKKDAIREVIASNPQMAQDPNVQFALSYMEKTGDTTPADNIIANLTKPKVDDTQALLRSDVNRRTVEQYDEKTGSWGPLKGPIPKNAHWLQEPTPSGTNSGQLSAASEGAQIERMQRRWDNAGAIGRDMERNLGIMEAGLKEYKTSPMAASQAVLITFQRMLDPTSVVRESEYARSAAGLSLLSRIQGYAERLRQGGAGVPEADLQAMVTTARQFMAGANSHREAIRGRMARTAQRFNIPEDLVFEDDGGAAPPLPGDNTPAAPTAPGGRATGAGTGGGPPAETPAQKAARYISEVQGKK